MFYIHYRWTKLFDPQNSIQGRSDSNENSSYPMFWFDIETKHCVFSLKFKTVTRKIETTTYKISIKFDLKGKNIRFQWLNSKKQIVYDGKKRNVDITSHNAISWYIETAR
jgi:hypothetical protein